MTIVQYTMITIHSLPTSVSRWWYFAGGLCTYGYGGLAVAIVINHIGC